MWNYRKKQFGWVNIHVAIFDRHTASSSSFIIKVCSQIKACVYLIDDSNLNINGNLAKVFNILIALHDFMAVT